jgi:hypothetical protein
MRGSQIWGKQENMIPINLDYSRVEVAVGVRRRAMKLWSSTAIGPQQSRCSEIGSPEGEKMPT